MTPLRRRLREETRAAHDRVDAAFGRHDLASRAGYRAFLAQHARAVLPVEAALERAGVGDLIADWPERRRADALRRDLAALGTPAGMALPFALDGEAEALGALYVMEGSRLGARLLVRTVTESPDASVRAATAYLDHGVGTTLWPRFVNELEQSVHARRAPDRVVAGALKTFAVFEQAAGVTMEAAGD